MLASECASLSLPSKGGPQLSEEQWRTHSDRFCLWLSPLASLARHAEPQHPGDRDNRRSLPSGQSRVLVDTEPGKWLSVKSDQGDILRIVDILVFYFSKTGILIFLIQILMAFIHTNW